MGIDFGPKQLHRYSKIPDLSIVWKWHLLAKLTFQQFSLNFRNRSFTPRQTCWTNCCEWESFSSLFLSKRPQTSVCFDLLSSLNDPFCAKRHASAGKPHTKMHQKIFVFQNFFSLLTNNVSLILVLIKKPEIFVCKLQLIAIQSFFIPKQSKEVNQKLYSKSNVLSTLSI